ncbi:MAG: restriction endonuclease subunit S [Clostridiales bacterium]|nr:restriction endonuclease subunit S [Clostridiales bacterium]
MKEKEMKRVPKLRFPEFTDDWEQRKLSMLCYNITVGIANSATHAYTDKGVVMFRNQNIKENFLDDSDIIHISENFEMKYINKRLKKNDLLVARTGYPGTACVVPEKYEGSQTFTTLIARLKEGANPYFACQYINSEYGKKYFLATQIGGGQKNSGAGILEDFPMTLAPTMEEQNQIADYFSTFDRLITLHQRKLKNLNVLKKCVMQKLFSQKVRFKADDGSEFPKWKEKRLGDVFTERTERSKGGETLLSVTIAQGIVRQSETDKRNTASENKSNYKIVKRNDLAYNTMRMWQGAEGVSEYDGIVSPAYTVITALDGNNSYFFEILFKQTFMLQIFQRYSQGLTSDTWNLKFPAFSEIKCLVPCEDEQNKIVECVKVLDSVIEKQKATLAAWEELKKGLLQQMFV